VQFLVQIERREQPSGDQRFRDGLAPRERLRGLELVEAGVIREIWRVAGRQANIGIWEATDSASPVQGLSANAQPKRPGNVVRERPGTVTRAYFQAGHGRVA
jgi:muconolactone delta-isomerase